LILIIILTLLEFVFIRVDSWFDHSGFWIPWHLLCSLSARMKTLLKIVFVMAVLGLLLLMGLHNRTPVDFSLPPVLKQTFQQPAALMYFAFFVIGVLTGAVITAGGGRRQLPPIPGNRP
jgi:uncharacterized integral membrane protein